MKASAEKSSSTVSRTTASQPFFAKAGGGDFFAPVNRTAVPAVQAKMTVGKTGDKFEREADKMADKVMRMPSPVSSAKEEKIQRKADERLQKKDETEKIQRAAQSEEKLQTAAMPEERLQKKEKEEIQKAEQPKDKLQKKEEEKVQKAALTEEKVQKKDDEKLKRQSEEKLQKAAMPEEKLQKKEKEEIQKAEQPKDKLQKKEEEKVQKAALTEEKVQKKDDEKLQKAPADEEKLQRKGDGTPSISSNVQSAIRSKINDGQPLSSDVRSFMEPRFSADFSNVRVHNDAESAGLSNQLSAKAFTYRNHIFFAKGQYQPGTSEGKQLLAHELSHTLQQGHGVQLQPNPVPSESKSVATSSEIVDLSTNTFNPSTKVKDEIDGQGDKGLDVRVQVKGLTEEGRVKIKSNKGGNYKSNSGSMPLRNPWADELGGLHINFKIINNEVTDGYASLIPSKGGKEDWLKKIKNNSSLLGGTGLKVGNFKKSVNSFANGKLTLGVNDLIVEVGGFFDAKFNISIENISRPKIDAEADINIKGITKGKLHLDNTQEKLAGEASLAVDFKSFNGNATIKYNSDGTVDIRGTAGYNADKLSGEIQLVATDLKSANNFAKDAIAAAGGQDNVQNAAPPAPVPAPKPGNKQLALAATGQLGFNLTDWFAGTVNVVVDGNGAVTVIGKIAPPAEIELFKQRDWDKQLIQFEAKAYYGVPLVGNLNLFANISLHALAKLGPAKIYQIEILGTYSTDPEIQKNIQISGSINISAYAGLRLRAEGGAGIELVGHDLKFGIGLNADVGVKAYADARPTIGYRDPGVFYISGTLEMVAQPMLGLGGDFFIELDSPWWSPAPDEKWIWPLFSKEWPLSDPIGLSATVKDYVLGSGVAPEIELKQPEFDPSKFMTSMVDDKLPNKSGQKGEGKGTFKEDGSVPKPVVQPTKPAAKKADAKPEKKKGAAPKGGKSDKPDKKAAAALDANKILKSNLEGLKNKEPYSQVELKKALGGIKSKVKGVSFKTQEKGDKWLVTPNGSGKKKSAGQIELAMKKEGTISEEAKKGLAALDQVTERYADNGATEEEMTAAVKSVRRKFKFKLLEIKKENGYWFYHYKINPNGDKKGPKNNTITPKKVAVGSWVKNLKNGGSFERVTASEGGLFLRKGGKGGEIKALRFLTSKVDGAAGSFSYNQEGKDWERTNFTHPSKYVIIEGNGVKFILEPIYQGREYIRPNFYNDTQEHLDDIRNKKLSKFVHPLDHTKFLSEGDAAAEAAETYTQTFKGKAIVPKEDASPDHDPPVSEHWTNRKGNDTTQSTRENWNNSLTTYKLMSWRLNRKLGSRGARYTEQVGINFRGPKDK